MSIAPDITDAQKLLQGAERFHLFCHRNPDGDALGSIFGLGLLLEQHFPGKEVQFHCIDPVPETFSFLPARSRLTNALPEKKEGDAYICVDCAVPKQTGLEESLPFVFDQSGSTLNIDHHPDNSLFGTVNILRPSSASTCEIIVEIADALGWHLSADVATCLLTGVYTDTGGLLHSNTTAQVYRTVARLLRSGARSHQMVKDVFRTAQISTLKLWGRVLEKISITEEGAAISAVTAGDFRATGADASELTGAIDYVNAIPGMRFSLILSERDGKVKGSLRTLRDDVDVAKMASKFQGGGHTKAAGFALPGKLKPEVRWKVVEE